MKQKLLLSAITLVSTASVMAAIQVPTYNALDLTSIVSDGYFHGNTVFADINNDGNPEMIVKGRDLNNGWATDILYLSGDGYNYSSATKISDPDGCSWERVVSTIDYNADGNVDLILGSSWGAKLLKGDGNGNFEYISDFSLDGEISIDGNDSERWYSGLTAIADFNADGYPDIITFCGNPREDQGEPVLFINNGGDGSFSRQYGIGLNAQRGGTIAVGDFNKDGFPDLAISGWSDSFGNDCIRLYKNNGHGSFSEVASDDFNNALAGSETGHIIFCDVNGDGWLDLFVTGQSCPQGWARQAAIYKNDNGTSFSKMDVSLPGVKVSGADWCDVNGDGNIDLVYSGEGDDGALTVVAINQGDGTFSANSTLMSGHRGGASVEVADFNNNLVPDVVLMGYNDNGPHFQIYNGLCSRGTNSLPTAPTDLNAVGSGNSTTFSWSAGSDKQTAAAALRYNIVVKTTDGKLHSMIPADYETGKLRTANVNSATTATSVTLAIKADYIESWSVQTIDGAKAASAFAAPAIAGIADANVDNVKVVYANGALTVSADALVSVVNMSGMEVASINAIGGSSVALDLQTGIYAIKVVADGNCSVSKIAVK